MSNRNKKLVSFSIDKSILADFKKEAKDKKVNMSKWIQEKMKEYLSK